MWKKAVTIGFVAAMLGVVGCGSKFTCENMSKKNEKCMDEIMEVMLEGAGEMPEEMKKEMAEAFKKNLAGDAFIKMCEENMKKDDKKGDNEKIKECFKKSDCKEYAKCLKDSMKGGK